MDESDTTNPVEGEALSSAEVRPFESGHDEDAFADPEDCSEEGMLDEFGNPVGDEEGPGEERLEEIERNGRKATIPAWLKPELMMQADYIHRRSHSWWRLSHFWKWTVPRRKSCLTHKRG